VSENRPEDPHSAPAGRSVGRVGGLPVVLRASSSDDPTLLPLISAQEAEVMARYGVTDPGPGLTPGTPCVIALLDGRPVGCVAVAPLDATTGEVKRMYVSPGARGRSIGRLLLQHVEQMAAALGYSALKLETGTEQPEAVSLYRDEGWSVIPCYGYFKDDPSTICMEKRL
jgi:GNAT superfamily N-acetyltransferase